MAHQVYAAHPQQNRGTLPPGQTILVNKYTVQVERYLSQGGFAHVYVVRSATPINNTTQHVLKRIAVADEAMLNEVKKEVDIMRILRGHPNIVNLIDASWHALPNGLYEVFILMELCAGGGIIDMMNRRLRERLTEAEILQIFVDVCEAVAAMHNLKPPLLHRDLKVENILQSSLSRYKLCDFGSSIPVAPRPPASTQEIRALEADLNRHTTLQYRAPEMVDVYLRRSVDEKSDVWALGVLLYKLCYYTTPFEEHGPLAILNVQYKIPPYPVYSAQLNSLIASMLRELGAQRPSVFEILNTVHHMRGSKSPYRYNIPVQQPLHLTAQLPPQPAIDNIVSYRTSPVQNNNVNAAIQARQTVLEAIAPMRRGRPSAPPPSLSSSEPQLEKELGTRKFEEQWNAFKGAESRDAEDAWGLPEGKPKDKYKTGFGNAFDGFGDSFIESSSGKATPALAPSPTPPASKSVSSPWFAVKKDAFDGLGGVSRSRDPSPTLAEATGNTKPAANGSARPAPILSGISRTPLPALKVTPLSPRIPASRTGLATYHSSASLTAEERFPSLDELDKTWHSPPSSQTPPPHMSSQLELDSKSTMETQLLRPAQLNIPPQSNLTEGLRLSQSKSTDAPPRGEARSQQVTGTAMRDHQAEAAAATLAPTHSFSRPPSALDSLDKRQVPIGSSPTKYRPSRPALARKHRSSMSIKHTEPRSPPQDWLTGEDSTPVTSPVEPRRSPLKRRNSGAILSPAASATSVVQATLANLAQNTGVRYKQETKSPQEVVSSATDKASHNGDAPSIHPPVRAQPSGNEVRPRKDSSSSDAEGPEDVNGRVMDKDARKRRAKGRQSSVHDLVDLYGGGGRAPIDKERAGPSPVLGRKGRRTSGILVDLSVPSPGTSQPTLLSPATIIPESRAELASRRTGSSQGERISPPASLVDSREQNLRSSARTSPASSNSERADRPRPQSMFVFPPSKPAPDPSPHLGAHGGPRTRPSPRRGSISDMVDLYENMGSGSRLKDPPPIANKPAGLKTTKTPSPVASRFPAISPTGISFPISQMTSISADLPRPKPRRSPTTGSSSDASPIWPLPSQQLKDNDDLISRVPRRQSVSPAKQKTASVKPKNTVDPSPSKPAKPASLSIPMPPAFSSSERRATTETTPISSPSPERPYQGVGKLIDQWQKKTEEAEGIRQPAPRAPGRPLGPRAAFARRDAGQVGRSV